LQGNSIGSSHVTPRRLAGLTAGVSSMASLLVVRVVFGAGEGPYATYTNKMLNGSFEHSKQTTAVGFANAG
jgi:MFS transporter, ACS family, hexuronate transporter